MQVESGISSSNLEVPEESPNEGTIHSKHASGFGKQQLPKQTDLAKESDSGPPEITTMIKTTSKAKRKKDLKRLNLKSSPASNSECFSNSSELRALRNPNKIKIEREPLVSETKKFDESVERDLALVGKRRRKMSSRGSNHTSPKKKRRSKQSSRKSSRRSAGRTPLKKRKKKKKTYSEKLKSLTERNKFMNWVIMLSLVLSINFSGYYIVISNVMAQPLTKFVYGLDKRQQSIKTGEFGTFYALGALFAKLTISLVTRYIGRVKSVLILEVVKIIICMMYRIPDLRVLLTMRLVTGIASGYQTSIVPLIGNEMMPRSIGTIGGAMYYTNQTLFMLIASLMPAILGGQKWLIQEWRLVMSWPIIFCFITIMLILSTIGFKETPDYYIENTHDNARLKDLIVNTMKVIYTDESAERFYQIKMYEIKKRRKEAKKDIYVMNPSNMCSKRYRNQLFVGIMLNILQQSGGISFMIYFSTQIFDEISGQGPLITVLLGIGNFAGSILSLFIIKTSRKSGLLKSSFMYSLSIVGLFFGAYLKNSFIMGTCILAYIVSFSCGLASIMAIYLVEILPPFGLGMALTAQWLVSAMVGLIAPPLLEKLGVLVLFGGLFVGSVMFLIFVHFFCMETEGLSKEEIERAHMTGEFVNFGKKKKKSRKNSKDIAANRKPNKGVVEIFNNGMETGRELNGTARNKDDSLHGDFGLGHKN